MQVIPSLDIQGGRSRLVWWPGASAGAGAPTDRPEVIARVLVEAGAPAIHLVDLDGARQGRPANLAIISAVARSMSLPLQVAGGIDGPEQIELAFAAGATRVVMPLWSVAEDRQLLRQGLRVAGDWLAVGLDARPERLRQYPWRQGEAPLLGDRVRDLQAEGVRRFVLSHGGASPNPTMLVDLSRGLDAEIVVAGGVSTLEGVATLRDAGVSALLVGEVLFTGALELSEAARVAAAIGA
ncbi:1-(5-phosphoribosyl)-5-[(5-phosphoribosylamino)methylideneamino]imidazole-4-carboxamide isomerase [soil metagenome]